MKEFEYSVLCGVFYKNSTFQLKLHQVLNTDSMHSTSGLRLLDIQTISMYSHGWFAFKVTKAVQSWRNDQTTNHGM